VIDRFLEHSRIYHFLNGGEQEVWVSSGDWMPRNFFRRIEVTYPILDPLVRKRLVDEVLAIGMADDTKGWRLLSDGRYERRTGRRIRSQEKLIEIARSEAVPVGPYEETLKRPSSIRKKAKQLRKKSSR
jgi:polyphosphate kinase